MKKLTLAIVCATIGLSALAQTAPTVTTDTRYARGATMIFARATFKINGGNTISERGLCYSTTNPQPTTEDATCKDYLSNNGLIYKLSNLQPATKYYVRPYAIGKDGSVGYGEPLKIYTLPQGNIAWGYDNGGSSAENERINNAVGSCVDYWNNLTNITGLYLNVHYGAATPTADCSYGGWMRVGPNASYQKTGTIMHEALHAIGVGTHAIWNSPTSPLRAGSGTGTWLGNRATEFVRFWDNSTTATINGDGTHLWPYGINGAHEDNGTEVLYTATSLLAQAVGEDGLPCTNQRSFGSPHYAFDQEDTIRYYIKNEDEKYGLLTSYLVETADHKLTWKTLSAEEAVASDAAAWYVTFTPGNQYYQFKNAASGYYITYTASGTSGIGTKVASTSGDSQNFHLLKSRTDVTSASGAKVCNERSYWVLYPNNSTATPPALSATTDGKITTSSFDIGNDAKAQRWLILTAAQAAAMENSSLTAARESFSARYADIEQLISTPHSELQEGADAELTQTLVQIKASADNAMTTGALASLTTQVEQAGMQFLSKVCVSDMEHPFDLSFMLVNPTFATDMSGWTLSAGAVWNYSEVEYYEKSITMSQTVKNMPMGTFQLRAYGFQRPGSNATVYADYTSGTDKVGARLYIDSAIKGYQLMKNVMADRSSTSLHADDKRMDDGTYVPNTMASAAAHFKQGYYLNTTEYYRAAAGDLKAGITASNNNGTSFWTIFTNFGLHYFGPLTREEIENHITGISEVKTEVNADAAIYNINGQRILNTSLPAGIYLQGNHKFIIR